MKKVQGLFTLGIFAPRSESLLGAKVPTGNFRSQERKFQGTFALGIFRSRELSFQGANVPGNIRSAERYQGANCTSET